MEFIVDRHYGGIRGHEKYILAAEDVEGEKSWYELQHEFNSVFGSLNHDSDSYELGSWHHGTMNLWANLYTNRFYNSSFIPAISQILEAIDRPAYAEFECFTNERQLLGCFQVYDDNAIFDPSAEASGLLARLTSGPSNQNSQAD